METKQDDVLSYKQLNVGYIVLKNNIPTVVTKEILIDIIQNVDSYTPYIITVELFDKIGFYKSTNPINKDVYFDIGDSIARIIYDNKHKSFRLNFKYSIKNQNRELSNTLEISSINQLQFYLELFYNISLNADSLMKIIVKK
ncbi:MAG: hypothetical protein C0448_02555 [Sphingobacteriaceae bacterium]|nr:hypothetical protein [Sphingobacteriaceae bacterium]